MPVFEIQTADGKTLQVEAPSQDAAISAIKSIDQKQKASLGHKIGATIDGIAQSLTLGFSDEMAAGLSTGFGFAGDYSKALDAERARMEENKNLASGFYLAGELAGALGGGVGLAKAGLSLVGRTAGKGIGTRIAAGAGEGAAMGAAYGAGTADGGIGDRASGAVSGAAVGGGIGGAVPVAGAALLGAGEAAYGAIAPKVNAVIRPEAEAARRVGTAITRDATMRQPVLGVDELAAAKRNGQDIRNFDRGGETVRALARSVANQSPESRGAITRAVSDRFETQGERVKNVLNRIASQPAESASREIVPYNKEAARASQIIYDMASGGVDDLRFQEALRSSAAKSNKGAYDKAFAYNFGPEQSMVFDELAQRVPAQAVANAMKVAKAEGRPFGEQLIASIDETTNAVTFSRAPSMREWHYIQRGLRSAADSAYRNGAGEVGTAYKQLHREILGAMDEANPLYQQARQGAAKFFQADDALEAGRKFVTQSKDLRQSFKEIGKMTQAERNAFKVGFASELREQISKVRDRRNVVQQIFGSDAARKKIEIVFGRQGAREMEDFVNVETAMDQMRNALGNSTTARQLVELGLGAGAGYTYSGDMTGAITGAMLAKGARMAGARAEEKVMRRVADMLLSSDPNALKKAYTMVSKSEASKKALTAIQDYVENAVRSSGIQQSASQ